ncbi:MAG: Bax inhibitor-1/YccA family protein [Ignavibacteria bacterium]|nr:Bax inhibitor-1/YccA family protein [Ignavibacteria bacterium]
MDYTKYNQNNPYQNQDVAVPGIDVSKKFLLNVYNWMTIGLALTGITAFFLSSSTTFTEYLIENSGIFWFLLILQLIVVFALSFAITKIPAMVAIGAFLFYSFLTGITFSVLFLIFTGESIALTFFICAGMFASVSVYGYITKRDLSGLGTFMYMGLIGLILATVVNIFLQNSVIYWITTYAGVIIFTGLTAWDTQKIKNLSSQVDYGTEQGKKMAIMGALTLYLDFINLFLMLLRLFGERK